MKSSAISTCIAGEEVLLLPEKAVLWRRKKTLFAADLHLGKSAHFRKSGIPVSSQVQDDDLRKLTAILTEFSIEKIYLLGDLFHSKLNNEWDHFIRWRKQYGNIEFHLTKGNHDLLHEELISKGSIIYHPDDLHDDPFIFSHQIPEEVEVNGYRLSGHIHPSVRLSGKGLQSISFPCFWFGKTYGVLPSFGSFTGHHIIKPMRGDLVFVIYDNQVKQVVKNRI